MNPYRVDYTLKNGGGLQRQEVIFARSDFEARQILKSRYDRDRLHIVLVVKQPSQSQQGGRT